MNDNFHFFCLHFFYYNTKEISVFVQKKIEQKVDISLIFSNFRNKKSHKINVFK
ncbi:hypothetical protein HMPREF9171_1454 [Streptococcus agalactiae ATCC 13813]|nr:hypothetical protein HMPREF9171_1454 [Streptococcus agalactiae ATCC 13813]MCA5916220.1 hypothetical protein [Streptococcus agalactiae]